MTGAESLSLGTQPVTENSSALSLSWGVASGPILTFATALG